MCLNLFTLISKHCTNDSSCICSRHFVLSPDVQPTTRRHRLMYSQAGESGVSWFYGLNASHRGLVWGERFCAVCVTRWTRKLQCPVLKLLTQLRFVSVDFECSPNIYCFLNFRSKWVDSSLYQATNREDTHTQAGKHRCWRLSYSQVFCVVWFVGCRWPTFWRAFRVQNLKQ